MLTSSLKDMIKDAKEEPDDEVHGKSLGWYPVWELPSPWSWGVPPSPCGDVFTSPEALQNPASLDCYEGFLR